ncbi:Plasmodium exported protein (PHISTa), unknown, putative [Plasmodium gaboni]|uniref:Plasmodium RESA N-terminal domain-containing protein n=1 Tax=Plasmodium gaboni TaxID=647221 RepID=A0ABY0KWH2_9APIC|nr:Plasmodium exported protein (PHISTa), unknown, putative [Plasmodium gaboni]
MWKIKKRNCLKLNSFEECPSKEDLRYIWSHTIGVAKEVLDNLFKESKASIQKYLDNDILERTDGYGFKYFVYDEMWKLYIFQFSKEVAIEEVEYTNKFFNLIKINIHMMIY